MKQKLQQRFLVWVIFLIPFYLAQGQQKQEGAQAILKASKELSLTESQITTIEAIKARAMLNYRNAKPENRQNVRLEALDQALAALTPEQKNIWMKIHLPKDKIDDSSRSLIIPTIDQLKKPPSPSAYGRTTNLVKTKPHPVTGNHYIILTDHTDPVALKALQKLAKHRNGEVVNLPSLGTIHKDIRAGGRLQKLLQQKNPNYVAIAPTVNSYRENLHLFMLKLLSSIDSDPELDAFPGYLMASNPKSLASLVESTINYTPLSPDEIKPVSIGAIEDDDSRRYRSYQKAKVVQKMFNDNGQPAPSVIITTRKKHTARADFPDLKAQGDISMLPDSDRHTHRLLSSAALASLDKNNMLFMFGHGSTNRICGTYIEAFAKVDFANEIVFCGSCMSATPYQADRLNLDSKSGNKRFAFHAMDNGAVMLLGHMALCGGFPKVYPVAESVLEGLSAGEAYQRLMNSLILKTGIPDYYPDNPPKRIEKKEPANGLLYVLWGDPALVAVNHK